MLISRGGIPSPVLTPPTVQLDDVTKGYVPRDTDGRAVCVCVCVCVYVCTKVNVQHGSVGAFYNDFFLVLNGMVEVPHRVSHHGLNTVHIRLTEKRCSHLPQKKVRTGRTLHCVISSSTLTSKPGNLMSNGCSPV